MKMLIVAQLFSKTKGQIEMNEIIDIRRTQLLLPPALKVAKSDFEP